MMQSVNCNTDNDVYQADNDGPKMHPLPNNVLNASELYSIVTSDKPTFTSIPMGQKNNCYMLLDNSTNVERKKSNKKSQFSDDLESWNSDSGTTVNTHYVISHDFKCAYMKNGLYCFPKKVNNKRTFIPISPQPSESDVVTLHKYYTTLSICLTTLMYSTMALVERSWLPGLLNQVTRFFKSGCRFKVV
jgi:hypothetical protein